MVSPSAARSLSSTGFARDLCALLSRFRQTDCNRLLPALYGSPTPAGFECSLFPPTHRTLDALRGRLTVFPAARGFLRSHYCPPFWCFLYAAPNRLARVVPENQR